MLGLSLSFSDLDVTFYCSSDLIQVVLHFLVTCSFNSRYIVADGWLFFSNCSRFSAINLHTSSC